MLGGLPEVQLSDVREIALLGVLQISNEAAGRRDRRGPILHAETVEGPHPELRAQGVARPRHIETPRLGSSDRNLTEIGQARFGVEVGWHDDFARLQDGDLVEDALAAGRAAELGSVELSSREVQQRDTEDRRFTVAARRLGGSRHQRHQKGRLTCIQMRGVDERARGDDAYDFTTHEPLGLLRILNLIADRDPKPLVHEPSDVTVRRVKRHAAHRNPDAVPVLGTRRQGQFERARCRQGVLVEHLVEIAHAKEEQSVGVLLLGVQVLTHRGRNARTRCAGRQGASRRLRARGVEGVG